MGAPPGATLTSVNLDAPGDSGSIYAMRRVSLTDDGGQAIAAGINALRFTFSDTGVTASPVPWPYGPAAATYGEIAVYGTPTPEPSTLVLLTVGLIGLLAYAWRKRR